MNKDFLKYASFALMGLYLFQKTKNQGMGGEYQMLHKKADDLVGKLNLEPSLADRIKIMTRALIDQHMGVRSINGKK